MVHTKTKRSKGVETQFIASLSVTSVAKENLAYLARSARTTYNSPWYACAGARENKRKQEKVGITEKAELWK